MVVLTVIKRFTPDFENPENFVKLLELEFQYSSFRMDTFSYPKRNGFVQDTLENILGELINFKSNEKDFKKPSATMMAGYGGRDEFR